VGRLGVSLGIEHLKFRLGIAAFSPHHHPAFPTVTLLSYPIPPNQATQCNY